MTRALSLRLYSALLTLFPRRFRRRHGVEMEAVFLDLLDDARRRQGFRGLLCVWAHAVGDLVRHAPAEHLHEWHRSRPNEPDRPVFRPYFREESTMGTIIQDFRYSVRALIQRPLFTVTVVVTLALGIGANTAIFSLIDAVLLHPVGGIAEPEGVVALANHSRAWFSYPDFEDVREATEDVFSAVAVTRVVKLDLGHGDMAERVHGELVSGSYFSLLGVVPALGRPLEPDDEERQVVVLSHGLWQRRFGSDPAVLGTTVLVNGQGHTVIGVAPAGFRGTRIRDAPDLWAPVTRFGHFVPAMGSQALTERFWLMFLPIARLAPAMAPETAQTRLESIAAELDEAHPAGKARGYEVLPLRLSAFRLTERQDVRRYTSLLAAAAGLVLLIACLNVASLLGVRASTRRQELAVRLALGSDRARLVRQLLVESLLLALAGGVAGVILARWSFDFLARLDLPGSIRPELALDVRILAFGFVLSLVTGIAFGLLPALRASRPALIPALKGDTSGAGRRLDLRGLLVVTQMTLSLVLLIGAGLLLRTLWNLSSVDPGFVREQVLTAAIDLDLQGYEEEQGWAFYQELQERLEVLPGVSSVSLTSELPMSGRGSSMGLFVEADGSGPHNDVTQSIVGAGFFRTMGIPLVEGRDFTRQDRADAPWVFMVNETLARRFWPGESAVGKRLGVSGTGGPFYEIVGVVRDHRHADLRQRPAPHLYWAHLQLYGMMSGSAKTLVLRTEGDPATLLTQVRREIRPLDPSLALYDVTTLSSHVADSLRQERQTSLLLGAFAAVALSLAAVGLYGVLAWSVARRRHEIGIRVALGARPQDALRHVVWSGVRLALVGIVLGVAGSRLLERFLSGLLFEVEPSDPWTLLSTAGVLLAVAVVASVLPARRAAGVDPMVALRYE